MPAAKKPTGSIMRCTVPGGFHSQGKNEDYSTFVGFGELVRSSHPAVKAHPEFFENLDDFDRPEVEQATAAPGEKRK